MQNSRLDTFADPDTSSAFLREWGDDLEKLTAILGSATDVFWLVNDTTGGSPDTNALFGMMRTIEFCQQQLKMIGRQSAYAARVMSNSDAMGEAGKQCTEMPDAGVCTATTAVTPDLADIRKRVDDIAAIIWGLAAVDKSYRDGVGKDEVDEYFNGACGIVSSAQRAISNLQELLNAAPEGGAE